MNNLSKGEPDGDKGRRLGGKARVRALARVPVDDSGRTHAQFWAMLGWMKLVKQRGREEAGREMARRGMTGFMKERQAYSRYLGEMRKMAEGGNDG